MKNYSQLSEISQQKTSLYQKFLPEIPAPIWSKEVMQLSKDYSVGAGNRLNHFESMCAGGVNDLV